MKKRSTRPDLKPGINGSNALTTIGYLQAHGSVLFCGLLDSISVHKTLPVLVNSKTVAWLTFQILAANGVLLLGSMALLDRVISPFLAHFNEHMLQENASAMAALYTNEVVAVLYTSLWLVPITILCYVCSMFWYQDLANATYTYLFGAAKSSSLTKSADHALYATLVWLFIFLQVQLLTVLCPLACGLLDIGAVVFCRGLESSSLLSPTITSFIRQLLRQSIMCSSYLLLTTGLIIMCFLYGWYGFDYKWISAGVSPDERFAVMESHWAYFIGFGLPYVVLLKTTSFFFGFGFFLACFPLSIMLGTMSDYDGPYNTYFKKSDSAAGAVALFGPARQLTERTINFIETRTKMMSSSKISKDTKKSR